MHRSFARSDPGPGLGHGPHLPGSSQGEHRRTGPIGNRQRWRRRRGPQDPGPRTTT